MPKGRVVPLLTDPILIKLVMDHIAVLYKAGVKESRIKVALAKYGITPKQYWKYWEEYKLKHNLKPRSILKVKPVCYVCGLRLRYNDNINYVLDWRRKKRKAHTLCIRMVGMYY